MSKVILNIYNNPVSYDKETVIFEPGESVLDAIRRIFPDGFKRQTHMVLNGVKLETLDDLSITLKNGDVWNIYIYPEGIIVAAVVGVVAYIASYYVVDSLKPTLDTPQLPSPYKKGSAQNNYNLREQSNVARYRESIPSAYGKIKWYPDLATRSYFRYYGYNQEAPTLHTLLCLGHGKFNIEDVAFGGYSILNDAGLEYELFGPGETQDFIDDNVVTLDNIRNLNVDNYLKYSRQKTTVNFFKSGGVTYIEGATNDVYTNFLKEGDRFRIICDDPAYAKEYTVYALPNDNRIVPTSSTGWVVGESNLKDVYIVRSDVYIEDEYSEANTGVARVDTDIGFYIREAGMGYTTLSNPSQSDFNIELDLVFPDGLYSLDYSTGEMDTEVPIEDFYITMIGIKENGDVADKQYTLVDSIALSSVSSTIFSWTGDWVNDQSYVPDLVFPSGKGTSFTQPSFYTGSYPNIVNIDPSDIDDINYTTKRVTFKTAKVGTVRANNVIFEHVNESLLRCEFRVGFGIILPELDYVFPYGRGFRSPVKRSVRANLGITNIHRSNGEFNILKTYKIAMAPIFKPSLEGRDIDNVVNYFTIERIKVIYDNVQDYPSTSLLAIKYTAKNKDIPNDNLAITTQRKLIRWDGEAFTSPTQTRSIAWALLDVWMATYGASKNYTEIDLPKLLELDTVWQSRGDTFDAVFDSSLTVWEALQRIARAGRAKPIFDGVQLTFVRDGEQTTPTMLFNNQNIVKNSFSLKYVFPDNQTPDGIIVKYQDEDNDYRPAEVSSRDDISLPKSIDLFGVVNYRQAWAESQYLAAQQDYSRLEISFGTELAGHLPFPGDLISLSHDLPGWGQNGQITGKSGVVLTTSEPLNWEGSGPFYVSFMEPDGSYNGQHLVTEGSMAYEMILDEDVTDFEFITELINEQRTVYQFGENKNCVVTSISLDQNNQGVKITCTPYIQAIHDADTGTPPNKQEVFVLTQATPPKASGLILTNEPGSGEVIAIWNPSDVATSYKIQKSTDNTTWVDVSTPSITTETISATGLIYVRVANRIGSNVGSYISQAILAS